jgi:DNA-binding SARP family transcriptional activator
MRQVTNGQANEEADPPLYRVWMCGTFIVERRVGMAYQPLAGKEWHGSNDPRRLLKKVLCSRGRHVRREDILNSLWPGVDPKDSRGYLSDAAYKLRAALRPPGKESLFITARDASYYQLPDQQVLWTDADAALYLLEKAEEAIHTGSDPFALVEEAASYLTQGRFLEEEEGSWVYGRRRTIDDARHGCLLWQARLYEQRGSLRKAELLLRTLLEEEPTDGDALGYLMENLHQQRRSAEALRLYQETKQICKREAFPLPASTTAIAEHIRSQPSVGSQMPRRDIAHDASLATEIASIASIFPSEPGLQDLRSLLTDAITQGIMEAVREFGGKNMDKVRRHMLQQMIGVLGGSASLPLWEVLHPDVLKTLCQKREHVDRYNMSMYERLLASGWQASYTHSIQHASGLVSCGLDMLNDALKDASGMQRFQINAMRSRFYRLSSIVVRDRLDFVQAAADEQLAIDLACELDDAELIAAALNTRAGTYIRQRRYGLALEDIERALPYADRSRDILKGVVYSTTSLIRSHIKGYEKDMQMHILRDLDTVSVIASKKRLEQDSSFLKLNQAGIQIERAKVLMQFEVFKDLDQRDFKQARHAFACAHEVLQPELVSWQANILLEEADLDLAEHDIDSCCRRAIQAWQIARTIHSPSKEKRIRHLYIQCQQLAPNHLQVSRLGKEIVMS